MNFFRNANAKVAKRRRLTASAVAAGLGGSLLIAASMGASLSSLTASIQNSTNTAASAALAITETGTTNATGTCNSYDTTATCATINKYGGTGTPLVPGDSQTQVVTFTNSGSVAVGSSTLVPTACTARQGGRPAGASTPSATNTDPSNLCSVLQVKVYKGATTTTPIYTGPMSGFTATQTLGTLAVNASQAYTFVVTLPATATTAVQGQQVSQPLTWNYNAVGRPLGRSGQTIRGDSRETT